MRDFLSSFKKRPKIKEIDLVFMLKKNYVVVLLGAFLGILLGYNVISFISFIEIPESIAAVPIFLKLLGIFALLALSVLIFCFPEIGLVLCLVIGSTVKGIIQEFLGPIDITIFLFLVTYLSIFVRILEKKKDFLFPSVRINMLILGLLIMLTLSLLYTPLPREGSIIFFRFLILTVSIFYAVFMWITDIQRAKRLIIAFVVVSLSYGMISLGIISFLGLRGEYIGLRGVLPGSPAISATTILSAGIIDLFAILFFIKNKTAKIILGIIMMIETIGVLIANTRGSMLAFLVGAIFFLFICPREHKKYIFILFGFIIVFIGLGLMFLPKHYIGRYSLITDFESSAISERLMAWQFVGEHFREWFLFGAGLFGYAWHYYLAKGGEFSIEGTYPHNLYMDVFASAGFFSVVVLVCFIVVVFYIGIKRAKKSPSWIIIASLLSFVIFLMNSLFSMSLINTRPLWFFSGVILALERIYEKESMHSNIDTRAG